MRNQNELGEPDISKCTKCEGSGWDFKGRPPPYPKCDCPEELQESIKPVGGKEEKEEQLAQMFGF
jgi:hypothetical protein